MTLQPYEYLTHWLVIVTVVAGGIFFWAIVKTEGRVRFSFLLFMTCAMAYEYFLHLLYFPDFSPESRLFVARGIFASACLLFPSFALFGVFFMNLDRELREPRFYIFLLVFVSFSVVSFSDLMILDAIATPEKVILTYGLLHIPFLITVGVVGFGYVFGFLFYWKGYRSCTDESLIHQIKLLRLCAIGTALPTFITNGILPRLLGDSTLSHISILWVFIFFAGVIHIIANGQLLAVRATFRDLLNQLAGYSTNNLIQFRRLAVGFSDILENNPKGFSQTLFFQGGPGEVPVQIGTPRQEPAPIFPDAIVPGLIENEGRMQRAQIDLAIKYEGLKYVIRQYQEFFQNNPNVPAPAIQLPDSEKPAEKLKLLFGKRTFSMVDALNYMEREELLELIRTKTVVRVPRNGLVLAEYRPLLISVNEKPDAHPLEILMTELDDPWSPFSWENIESALRPNEIKRLLQEGLVQRIPGTREFMLKKERIVGAMLADLGWERIRELMVEKTDKE